MKKCFGTVSEVEVKSVCWISGKSTQGKYERNDNVQMALLIFLYCLLYIGLLSASTAGTRKKVIKVLVWD